MGFIQAHQARMRPQLRGVALILFLLVTTPIVAEEGREPLYVRIDAALSELQPGPETPLCSDGEFMRRAYLDLLGTLPTGGQAREFIADPSPNKRAALIDQLLEDPGYASHMAQVFDLILMERRASKYVKADQWNGYLLTSFQQNKPLNELAREILAADGVDPNQRGPAKFYLEREVEPNLITREVGRVFFGMDLQCAQCHDHPNIDDYYQSDYYGLFAFVNRSYLFQPDKKQPAVLAEKAEGDAKFKSVFTEEEGETLPRLPGSVEIDEPVFGKDDAYHVKPDPKKKNIRPVPKHSRRATLAAQATDGSNHAFNRNLANRLWAHMMGQGLVHPVDQHHSDNPPAHPRLLDMLADELAGMNFDLKAMLRQLALSRTYQRTIDLPDEITSITDSTRTQLDTWSQLSTERKDAVGLTQSMVGMLETRRQQSVQQLPALTAAEKKANEQLGAAAKLASEAEQAITPGKQTLAEQQQLADLLASAAAQTAQAAQQLPADQALQDALGLLESRRQAAKAKADQLSAELASPMAVHQAAQAKLGEAQAAADQALRQRLSAELTIASLVKSLASTERQLALDRTVISHAKKQSQRWKTALAYGEAVQRQQTLQNQAQGLVNRLADSRQSIASLEQELSRLNTQTPTGETESALNESKASMSAELGAAREQSDSLQKQHTALTGQLADQREKTEVLRAALAKAWSEQFSIAMVQPLTPEQLAKSILKATGYDIRQRESVKAAINKKTPLKPEEQQDPAKLAAREQQIDAETKKKIDAIVARFVRLFGAAAGQPQDDFFATVDQALFFGNGGEMRGWLSPSSGNLTDRLQKIEDSKTLAEELYLSILTRLPSEQETADVTSYLASQDKQKRDAVQELAWALLTSAEFRFQH